MLGALRRARLFRTTHLWVGLDPRLAASVLDHVEIEEVVVVVRVTFMVLIEDRCWRVINEVFIQVVAREGNLRQLLSLSRLNVEQVAIRQVLARVGKRLGAQELD